MLLHVAWQVPKTVMKLGMMFPKCRWILEPEDTSSSVLDAVWCRETTWHAPWRNRIVGEMDSHFVKMFLFSALRVESVSPNHAYDNSEIADEVFMLVEIDNIIPHRWKTTVVYRSLFQWCFPTFWDQHQNTSPQSHDVLVVWWWLLLLFPDLEQMRGFA